MGRALTRAARQELVILTLAGVVLGLSLCPPVVQVGRELVTSGSAIGLLASRRLWWLLARSLGLSTAVTLLALAVGVPLGVLFSKARFPMRRLLLSAHVSVVFMPPFLAALGWFQVFGRQGWLGSTLSTGLLFSELGVVFVLAACFTPIVTALTVIGVSGIDSSLEDAARICGGAWRAAVLILLPCAFPAIALSGVVVFALAFSELGVPMFLRVDVYPAVIFARLGGMDFAPGEAAVFVVPLMGVAAGISWVERRYAGRRAIAVLGSREGAQGSLFGARPGFLVPALLAAGTSSLPLAALAGHVAASGDVAEVLRWIGDAPSNSLRSSALAAVLMTGIALVIGHASARGQRAAGWLDGLAMWAFILPSSIIGVGMVQMWNRPATAWLYTSFGILVIGFVARYSAVTIRTFAASVAQVPVSLEEAARTVGAGYVRRLGIVAGLARRGLVTTFILGWLFALRDLELAALFYPPGGEPLTVRIFTLEANGPRAVISALALLHVGITFAVVGIGVAFLGRRRVA